MTVNGVTATDDYWTMAETWYWAADNVPIYGQGTATFDAVATPAGQTTANAMMRTMIDTAALTGSTTSPAANSSTTREFEASMVTSTYHLHTYWNTDDGGPLPYGDDWTKHFTSGLVQGDDGWQSVFHGTVDDLYWDDDDGFNTNTTYVDWKTEDITHYDWSSTNANDYTLTLNYHNGAPAGSNRVDSVAEGVKIVPDSSEWGPEYFADGGACHWFLFYQTGESTEFEMDARTELTLYTGGKAKVNRQNLFCIHCNGGTEYKGTPWVPTGKDIPPEQMEAFGENFGTDGNRWIVLPDNAAPMVNLIAPGKKHYFAAASPTKYKSHFEVFVRQPDPGGTRGHIGGDWGHAWWCLSCDASRAVVDKLNNSNIDSQWLGAQVGYGPATNLNWLKMAPGHLYSSAGDPYHVHRCYEIGFSDLTNGLANTQGINDHPGTWSIANECVQTTRDIGEAVGVELPIPGLMTPEEFGNELKATPQLCP